MGFKTLQIKSTLHGWQTILIQTKGDYELTQCVPNATGWLHYDDQLTDAQAMTLLVTEMVAYRQNEINDLQADLDALKRHLEIDTPHTVMSPENTISTLSN